MNCFQLEALLILLIMLCVLSVAFLIGFLVYKVSALENYYADNRRDYNDTDNKDKDIKDLYVEDTKKPVYLKTYEPVEIPNRETLKNLSNSFFPSRYCYFSLIEDSNEEKIRLYEQSMIDFDTTPRMAFSEAKTLHRLSSVVSSDTTSKNELDTDVNIKNCIFF